jgi:hypothetical protein
MEMSPQIPASAFALSSLGRYPTFAHHPTCGRHDHHLVRPFGVPLCLGCAAMYPGIVAAIVGLFVAWPSRDFGTAFWIALASLGCAVPTFFQPFVQKRYYKIPARFLLGVGYGLVLGAGFLVPNTWVGWAIRVGMLVGTGVLTRIALEQRRKRLNDPCTNCPWGTFPLCAHNLPALRRIREERGADPFIDSLIAELSPLEAFPPRLGFVPPVQRAGQFEFHGAIPTNFAPPPAEVPSPAPPGSPT